MKTPDPDTPRRLLGKGQLVPPLLAQIRARQYFLVAIEEEVPQAVIDLHEIVYPRYCEDRRFSTSLITDWLDQYNLRDLEGQPLDWVRSCAEHTLQAWSIRDGLDWAKPVLGRPELASTTSYWARCNGLPAFETWLLDRGEAAQLTAELWNVPDFESYDWLVVMANGELAALDENGYRPVPVDMLRFASILRDGPVFDFNPLIETTTAARLRIKQEFAAWLDTFLDFAIETVSDWQGFLDETSKKESKHFNWAALHIAGGLTLAGVAETFGVDSVDTVATAVNEVRKLIGLHRDKGRPRSIQGTMPRKRH